MATDGVYFSYFKWPQMAFILVTSNGHRWRALNLKNRVSRKILGIFVDFVWNWNGRVASPAVWGAAGWARENDQIEPGRWYVRLGGQLPWIPPTGGQWSNGSQREKWTNCLHAIPPENIIFPMKLRLTRQRHLLSTAGTWLNVQSLLIRITNQRLTLKGPK